MSEEASVTHSPHPWRNFVLAFEGLYTVMAAVMTVTGAAPAAAFGTPAGVLTCPAIGMGIVRRRRTQAS
ncbi:hypothetical protein [Streptomyces sp. NBC_00691]|uniref:hypothetical protein n=1 Tax=Streptomyces sp. NBC_00691 TaxID=2903671 RepID=UPI002E32D9A6|nr:hypothetical protein [Streptomyces sp. NBC_00691]